MPTTVLIPASVSSLNAKHSNYGGGGAASLSDGASGTGYAGAAEVNNAAPSKSYFTTQGLPSGALPPFSNPQCFGYIFGVATAIPGGEYNEADTGLDNGGTESFWQRWNCDGGFSTIVSNNAYAAAPWSGTFTTPTTVAAVNAVRVLLSTERNISGADAGRNIAEAYWKIDHAASPGMTVAMILQWLGPLVAVGLHEMPRLARALFLRSLTIIRPDEYATAWRELREYRGKRMIHT